MSTIYLNRLVYEHTGQPARSRQKYKDAWDRSSDSPRNKVRIKLPEHCSEAFIQSAGPFAAHFYAETWAFGTLIKLNKAYKLF